MCWASVRRSTASFSSGRRWKLVHLASRASARSTEDIPVARCDGVMPEAACVVVDFLEVEVRAALIDALESAHYRMRISLVLVGCCRGRVWGSRSMLCWIQVTGRRILVTHPRDCGAVVLGRGSLDLDG